MGLQATNSLNAARDKQRLAETEPQTQSCSTAGLHETCSKQTDDSCKRLGFENTDLKSGYLLVAPG